MKFLAIDVETANADLASICRIGLLTFEEGGVTGAWRSLVNPEDYFDAHNVLVHGINEDAVKAAPTLPRIAGDLRGLLSGATLVCHTSFDRVALARALEKYALPAIDCLWLDTAKVARRAWPRFAKKGYSLANVAANLGIEFSPHVAHANARAAGEILLRAIQESGLTLEDWLLRVKRPIDLSSARIARDGNPEGTLAGEVVVFTGALELSRAQAAEAAARAGCAVGDSVGKHTTLLVLGNQDVRRLAGREKSSKHRKAEELIAGGQRIRIVGESDFLRLIDARRDEARAGGRLASVIAWLAKLSRGIFSSGMRH